MSIEVLKAKTEDILYNEKMFFDKIQKILEENFEKLWDMVKQDMIDNGIFDRISEEKMKDYFFDYIFNESRLISFDEYMSVFLK
jgi:very-short-patch-repair endonuclease